MRKTKIIAAEGKKDLIKKINDKILFSNYLAMMLLNLKGGDLSWFMRYYPRLSAQLLWV